MKTTDLVSLNMYPLPLNLVSLQTVRLLINPKKPEIMKEVALRS